MDSIETAVGLDGLFQNRYFADYAAGRRNV